MLLDEMRLFRDDDIQIVNSGSQDKRKKKKDFFEFDSNDETFTDNVDAEATAYLSDAKKCPGGTTLQLRSTCLNTKTKPVNRHKV